MSTSKISVKKWNQANKLLNVFPWAHEDYEDKWEWLKEQYGATLPKAELINRFVEQFDKEGLL